MRTAKTLIRLGGRPGWSVSWLGAHVILFILSCCGSFTSDDLRTLYVCWLSVWMTLSKVGHRDPHFMVTWAYYKGLSALSMDRNSVLLACVATNYQKVGAGVGEGRQWKGREEKSEKGEARYGEGEGKTGGEGRTISLHLPHKSSARTLSLSLSPLSLSLSLSLSLIRPTKEISTDSIMITVTIRRRILNIVQSAVIAKTGDNEILGVQGEIN